MKYQEQIETKEFGYEKWTEYFKIQPKDYFGGRMLLNSFSDENPIDDPEEHETGIIHNKAGTHIQSSMLTVMADSAEVEILLMDRNNWSFFPENVQKDLVSKLKRKVSIERPYEPDYLEFKKHLSEKWDKDKMKNYT